MKKLLISLAFILGFTTIVYAAPCQVNVGCTGTTTFTQNSFLYGNGVNPIGDMGTNFQFLNGNSIVHNLFTSFGQNNPHFLTGSSGNVTVANALEIGNDLYLGFGIRADIIMQDGNSDQVKINWDGTGIGQGLVIDPAFSGAVVNPNIILGSKGTTKVGIGTTSPYAALSVVGSTGVVADNFNATNTNATSVFQSVTAATTSVTRLEIPSQTVSGITQIINGSMLFDNSAKAFTYQAGGFQGYLVGLDALTGIQNCKIPTGNQTTGAYTAAVPLGTANQVIVTPAAGSCTWSLPQSINTTATPQFGRLAINEAAVGTQRLNVNGNVLVESTFKLGVGTSTQWSVLGVSAASGLSVPYFAVSSTTGTTNSTLFAIDQNGHRVTGGIKPNCGAGCSDVTGDDQTMRVVTGVGVSSVTVNFSTTYTYTPVCVATDESGGTTVSDASSTPSTVVLNLSASLTTKSIGVICQISSNFVN